MELTSKQYEGLKTAVDRYKLGERYTCISQKKPVWSNQLKLIKVLFIINDN